MQQRGFDPAAFAREGIEAARGRPSNDPRGFLAPLPRLEHACQWLLEVYTPDVDPEIIRAAIAVGYHSRAPELYQAQGGLLKRRMDARRGGRCNKKDVDLAGMEARYRELAAKDANKRALAVVLDDAKISRATYYRRRRAVREADPSK